jgi:hypothetical protein
MGQKPRHLIFFDTETKEIKGKNETELVFRLGSAVHYRTDKEIEVWKEFRKISDFWNFIFSRINEKENFYIIAHNLPFDFRIVKGFSEMKKRKFRMKKMIFEGTTNIFSFSDFKGRTIVFVDNMNFFKSSLAALGENVGVKKMDMKKDDLMKYCRNDVLIMLEAWKKYMKFLEINDLGNFALTIAGQAFNAYRHRFMKHEIYIHNNDKLALDERAAYHGGRTECFRIGKMPKKTYRLYDVNSMYPSVMKEYDYPVKYEKKIVHPKINDLRKILKTKGVIGRFLISTDEPVFPYYDTHNKKLIFPVGSFWTFLTTREIDYAIKNNMIKNIDYVRVYTMKNIFSDYVDFFYSKKVEYKNNGNESFTYICKLFLNSLYGKFGQRNKSYVRSNEKFEHDGNFYDVETGKEYRCINGNVEVLEGWKEGFNSMISIPAHITADARMKLWNIIKSIGRDHSYYCDTDSVITDRKTKTSKELGSLSLKAESPILNIRGNKDYVFGSDETIKGVRKNAKKISENSYEQTQFEGMAGAIMKNRIETVFIKQTIKTLKRDYDKGIILKDGRVAPFSIGNMI